MSNLDDLIEEFDGEEGMFHIGPKTQAEIKKLRKLVVELEAETSAQWDDGYYYGSQDAGQG